jgi:hypothetical protein
VVIFGMLWLALAARLAGALSGPALLAVLVFAIPTGHLLADLASGLAHWFADTFFEERTPVIGRLLIEPFREHHRDPAGITRHGFFEISGNNCLVTIPALGALWLWGSVESQAAGFGLALALSGAFSILATNQFHCWAHTPPRDLPRAAAWLQQRGLILSQRQHARHHSGSNDRAYCVTCGWLNPVLDRFQIFSRIESGVRFLRRRPGAHA